MISADAEPVIEALPLAIGGDVLAKFIICNNLSGCLV